MATTTNHGEPTIIEDTRDVLEGIISRDGRSTGGILLGLTRLSLGWTFLWAFLDKVFGLGFDTCRAEDGGIDVMCDSAFLAGGSSTWGFLSFGTQGSKTGDWVSWLATSGPGDIGIVDFLYLGALLIAGVSFTLGIAMRLGALAGAGLMVSIYIASSVWPQFNPFMDEHIIYALAMAALAAVGAGRYLGLGQWWAKQPLAARSWLLR